ncbi:MAG: anaerobic ribonucleoside-triphosphate reductase [Candidatus Margulisbacteria bacterium]|nr:anaerobic ribonucleoside-triphosphate reductase [Candidatus Margulisiibacteriota bacterium]
MGNDQENVCGKKMEIYSRIVGYFRPVSNWNGGKKEEFKDRLEYNVKNITEGKQVIDPVTISVKEKQSEQVKVAA